MLPVVVGEGWEGTAEVCEDVGEAGGICMSWRVCDASSCKGGGNAPGSSLRVSPLTGVQIGGLEERERGGG